MTATTRTARRLCGLRREITDAMIDNASERFARCVLIFSSLRQMRSKRMKIASVSSVNVFRTKWQFHRDGPGSRRAVLSMESSLTLRRLPAPMTSVLMVLRPNSWQRSHPRAKTICWVQENRITPSRQSSVRHATSVPCRTARATARSDRSTARRALRG
jgi:hypothetical protein